MNLPTAEEYKMNNIHLLPTDKPSRLFIDIDDNKLKITIPIGGEHMMNQHIYITNNEEIKEGDWMYYKHFGEDIVTKYNTWGGQNTNVNEHKDYYKKIILTTNQDLIKDGVQLIDEEFLEWFVKNPSCESVDVESFCKYGDDCPSQGAYDKKHLCDIGYKIIIPKEESKKETLEEAAESKYGIGYGAVDSINAFIAGAKWQSERMYSDEDIMMVIERVIYLKNGWTPEGWSFYRDNNEIKEEVMNLLKNK